jgi:hypothetical protein
MKNFPLLKLLSLASAFGAFYCLLAMFTQGMLGGASPAEVWRDRIYAWAFFLVAGWLAMAAIFLWRRANGYRRSSTTRLFVIPFGYLLLTGSLYFFDFSRAAPKSPQYMMIAAVLVLWRWWPFGTPRD